MEENSDSNLVIKEATMSISIGKNYASIDLRVGEHLFVFSHNGEFYNKIVTAKGFTQIFYDDNWKVEHFEKLEDAEAFIVENELEPLPDDNQEIEGV